MLTVLGIILIHQNVLNWCKTLDIALLGIWTPDLPGRPRTVTYVCTSPRDDQTFARDLDGRVGRHQFLNGQATDQHERRKWSFVLVVVA